MTKQVQWTQKYRPKNLAEYIGNKHMKLQLKTLIEQGEVPQTSMFYGEKGTGKTTFARLLVKNLMCDTPKEGEACGNCANCERLDNTYITSGKAPKATMIKELNIADLRGVADAEVIVKDMQKQVGFGRKRIFILDEMQQASPEAQSVFLKIVEEPVPNLYVIMCTTHPEKITEALASRFKRFRVKRPLINEIVSRMEIIARAEGVNFDKNALRIIASFYKNNPRESIGELQKLAVTTEYNLTVKAVEEQLDLISSKVYEEFLIVCKTGNLNNIVNLITTLENEGITITDFISGLGDFVVDLLKLRAGVKLDTYTLEQIRSLRKYVKGFSEQDIHYLLKVLKEYSVLNKSMEFLMYALATEVMTGLKIPEKVKEVTEPEAHKKFRETTKKIQDQNAVQKEIKYADEEYMSKKMRGASKVVGLPSKIE